MKNTFNILQKTTDGIIFNVKLVPNSSFTKIVDFTEDYIRIKISSPPLENRANKELLEFCSDFFNVSKSKLAIISGEKSKIKKILIKESDFDNISQKILFVLDSIKRDEKC